jgi:hypothetical protein
MFIKDSEKRVDYNLQVGREGGREGGREEWEECHPHMFIKDSEKRREWITICR